MIVYKIQEDINNSVIMADSTIFHSSRRPPPEIIKTFVSELNSGVTASYFSNSFNSTLNEEPELPKIRVLKIENY